MASASDLRLAQVEPFEGGGRLVNEWYSQNEYIQRRLGFLGGHPDFRRLPRLLPGIEEDADLVFDLQQEALSSQQIRERELACDVDPLLPFSTSTNTETLDDFHGYPATEWAPGFVPPAGVPRADTPEPAATETPGNQQTANNGSISSPSAAEASLPPAAVMASQSDSALNVPTPRTLQHMINALGQPLGTASPPPAPRYNAQNGVSAVSNRPVSVPVKTQKSLKRSAPAADDNETQSNHSDASDEAIPPPRKRSKETLNQDDQGDVIPSRTGAKLSLKAPAKKSTTKAKKATAPPATKKNARKGKQQARESSVSSETATPNQHDAIVTGRALPKTAEEAQAAASIRKQKVLDAFLAVHPLARHPDLPPEFFDTANYTKDERENMMSGDGGPVRCVCGENDPNSPHEWIGCDNEQCGVWQHQECVKGALPKSKKKRGEGDYLCQVCDPFAHRRLLQKLRRENVV